MTHYFIKTPYKNELSTSEATNEEQLSRKKLEYPSFIYFTKNEVRSADLNNSRETSNAFMIFIREYES